MLASYGQFENERALASHSVVKQGVKALAQGDSVGFTPRSEACERARLH